MWKRTVHIAWWIGVSLYFGGMVTLGAIVAPSVFDTSASAQLSMPKIPSPPLDISKQVGGEIFGDILNRFAWIELISLGLMLAGLAGMILLHKPARRSAWVLLALWVALISFATYDGSYLRPKVWNVREQVRATAFAHTNLPTSSATSAPAASPWPEREQFDALHTESETVGRLKAYLLLAMILVASARGIAEKPTYKTKPVNIEI